MKRKLIIPAAVILLLSGCGGSTEEVPAIAEIPVSETAEVFVSEAAETTAAEQVGQTTTTGVILTNDSEEQDIPKEQPDYEKFDEALEAAKEKYEIIGLTAALFKDGEVVYTKSLGYADRENELPCTDNTRYRIASVSKMISSMVTMTLYDKGIITPDTVLSEATGIEYDSPRRNEKVRLWHLLTHTAGIADTYDYEEVAVYSKAGINSLLVNAHTENEPGTVYSYSNFGAGSIGALVERLTDKFFYEYADEAIFAPLDMDAGFLLDKITDRESCAKLYDHDGEIFDVRNWGRKAAYYDSFGLGNSYYVAQCELIITAPDLARLGMALAGGGETGGVRILSEDAVGLMNKRWFETENFDMGLCVRIYDDLIEGRTIYGHPGNALGVITGLFYDPSDGSGIAFLTNHCLDRTDKNGFYKANKEALTAAYEYILDRL